MTVSGKPSRKGRVTASKRARLPLQLLREQLPGKGRGGEEPSLRCVEQISPQGIHVKWFFAHVARNA